MCSVSFFLDSANSLEFTAILDKLPGENPGLERPKTSVGKDIVATMLEEGLIWQAVPYAHEQTKQQNMRFRVSRSIQGRSR